MQLLVLYLITGKATCSEYLQLQVIKKWLSYREKALLGRSLTPDEAREVTNIARRLTAIVLLEPALNASYQQIKASAYSWSRQHG